MGFTEYEHRTYKIKDDFTILLKFGLVKLQFKLLQQCASNRRNNMNTLSPVTIAVTGLVLAEKEGFGPSLRSSRATPLAETAKPLILLGYMAIYWELVGSSYI